MRLSYYYCGAQVGGRQKWRFGGAAKGAHVREERSFDDVVGCGVRFGEGREMRKELQAMKQKRWIRQTREVATMERKMGWWELRLGRV